MTDDLYQKAKEVFSSLSELDTAQQESQLTKLNVESPELAEEVRSLLSYHTSKSLVVPQIGPKIRTRSTLSTTYQSRSWSWLVGPARGLLVALPLFVAGVGLALWAQQAVHRSVRDELSAHLSETIDHHVQEFRFWEKQQLSKAISWSQHEDVVAEIRALVALSEKHPPSASGEIRSELESASHAQQLGQALQQLCNSPVKYAVWDRRMVTIADWNQEASPEVLGAYVTHSGASMLLPVLKGNARMFLPKLGQTITEGYRLETSEPVLSILVPVYDQGVVIAALMVRGFGLEEQYEAMLSDWSARSQGETYLVNARGALLTASRYAGELERFDLAVDELGGRTAYLVRDPGVNLLNGESPEFGSSAWPLTLLARQVTAGNNGANTEGYRNYVGQQVVGVWRWLPDHQFGIAIENDFDVAYEITHLIRNALLAITSLFTLGLIGLTLAVAMKSIYRGRVRDVRDVGPYQMQEIIGEGGMGRVYLAEHALLCRQSAVKVLTKGLNDLSVVGRFEREVQLASQLTHPNTIAIYDFGRNRDGIFYYAMEYINGAHLGQLVEFTGPLPPGRCIYILRQLCRALHEAHQAGVVHRDIKPQNIMVCDRGGEPDFVKLFDYGLVKAFAPGVSHNSSQTRIVVGTPRFMAPERLNSPWLADPRVDVYSVGALAYFLLTAQLPPLVTSGDRMDDEHVGVETLDLPAKVIDFGGLLSVCLAVEPSSRPSSMISLLRELDELSKKFPWDRDESLDWWNANEAKLLLLVQNKRKKLQQSIAQNERVEKSS